MVVILLLLATFAWAKENFRVFPDTSAAAEACFLAGLCDAVNGCCSGHGYCNSTTTPTPTCVCAVPTGCHSSFTTPFSGNRCETGIIGNSLGSPDGCCISDTYDVKQEVNGACNPRSGNDPNTGLRGNLLRRSIYQNYTNPYTNNSVKDVADYLTDAARGAPEYTNFNMLALAILQVGQLDIVRYALSDTEFHNISGVLIPKLKHQNRTGEAWGNSTTLKKEFENLATGQIDLDFLYANGRVPETTYGTSGPYINYTSVLSQYSKIASKELLLLMEFFGHNHNFLVRTLEMANWNQTSFVTPFNHTALCKSYVATSLCSTYTTNQQFYDKLFEWARGANIRLLQIALGSALGLLAPNDQPTFDYYFHAPARNWQCFLNDGIFNSGSVADVAPDLSGGSIFADHITRNKPFTHLAASGIHYLYSMAEPVNYSSIVTSDPTCDVAVPTFAQKILLLSQTKIRKFGGRIDPSFYDGLTLQLLRERELGVESYNAWMAQTGDFVGRVDTDLYLGLHKDADSSNGEYSTSRLFQDAGVPRVLLALYTPINDALAIDDFGAWSIRDDGFTHDFLPAILSEQAYNQFSCAVGGYCVDNFNSNFQQQNAWTLLVGSRWGIEFAIPEQLFGPQSVMQTHVCTFPGYVGAMRTAGTIHAGFMAALLVDYPNGWTLPSYHSFNQQDQDLGGPMFRGLPNSISSCLPWRVVRKDEDLDTECCGIGICNCDSVFGASSPPCPEVNPCTSYDRIVSAHAYNDVFLNYLNSGFSDPVQPDGMS